MVCVLSLDRAERVDAAPLRSPIQQVRAGPRNGGPPSEPLHSDKISHLTYTLLTCLQIIKHNIAYMSAVGAEYAEVYFAT